MAVQMKGRTPGELFFIVIFALVLGIVSLLGYIFNLIKFGPSRWLGVKPRNERPEALDSEEYGVHHWIPLKKSRIKLHCVINGPKDKPLMLFLHGFPEFWYSWRHQIKEFSKDYRTVAVDLRGYGDSDKPCGVRQYTVDKLVDDIDQLIKALGYKKCVLVGHDWGGMLAWFYAILHEETVSRLIICNVMHPTAFERHLKTTFSQIKKSWYIFFFQWPVLPVLFMRTLDLKMLENAFMGKHMGAKKNTFTAEDIELFKYTFAEYRDLVGPVNYYRGAMRYGAPALPKSKLRSPTLVIWGTNDGALEKKMADMSGNYVEDFTLHYIEGASHWVQQEEPVKVNAFMREFLEQKGKLS